jgi:hypothetical protein
MEKKHMEIILQRGITLLPTVRITRPTLYVDLYKAIIRAKVNGQYEELQKQILCVIDATLNDCRKDLGQLEIIRKEVTEDMQSCAKK